MLEKMRTTPVSELMTREVKFIKEGVSLLDAVRKMKEFQVSSLIVESTSEADWYGIGCPDQFLRYEDTICSYYLSTIQSMLP